MFIEKEGKKKRGRGGACACAPCTIHVHWSGFTFTNNMSKLDIQASLVGCKLGDFL